MKRSIRFCARILDYIWFYGVLLLLLDLSNLNYLAYIITFMAIPLLFIPVEVLLLKLFGTTLGKSLFGIRYDKKFTWRLAAEVAGKKGIILQPLFTPVLGVFYAVFYFKELKKFPHTRWDNIHGMEVIRKKQPFIAKVIFLSLASLMTLFVTFPDSVINNTSRVLGIEAPISIQKHSARNFDSWIKISPTDQKFSIFFPNTPKFYEKDYAIPNSSKKLHVKEYHHDADMHFALTYTTLPSTWTFWGSNRVLKTALSQMQKHIGSIKQNSRSTHGYHPAISYVLKNGNTTSVGKLILVKNTLYRVEASSKGGLDQTSHEIATQFIDSLDIK